jgi:hypothetical protein
MSFRRQLPRRDLSSVFVVGLAVLFVQVSAAVGAGDAPYQPTFWASDVKRDALVWKLEFNECAYIRIWKHQPRGSHGADVPVRI